jgi:hypothetical protein
VEERLLMNKLTITDMKYRCYNRYALYITDTKNNNFLTHGTNKKEIIKLAKTLMYKYGVSVYDMQDEDLTSPVFSNE